MIPRICYLLAVGYVAAAWALDNPTYNTIAALWTLAGLLWERRT